MMFREEAKFIGLHQGQQDGGEGLRVFARKKMTGQTLFLKKKMTGQTLFWVKQNDGTRTFLQKKMTGRIRTILIKSIEKIPLQPYFSGL